MAVECVVDLQETVEDAARFQCARDFFQRCGFAGKCHRVRAVKRGDGDLAGKACGELLRLSRVQAGSEHPSSLGRGLHAAAAMKNHARRLAQSQNPGSVCGSDFADAMAHNRRRLDAPRLPQSRQRDLQ